MQGRKDFTPQLKSNLFKSDFKEVFFMLFCVLALKIRIVQRLLMLVVRAFRQPLIDDKYTQIMKRICNGILNHK